MSDEKCIWRHFLDEVPAMGIPVLSMYSALYGYISVCISAFERPYDRNPKKYDKDYYLVTPCEAGKYYLPALGEHNEPYVPNSEYMSYSKSYEFDIDKMMWMPLPQPIFNI